MHIILYIHTYTHIYPHIYTTCTYLLTDFDECADGIGCYSRYFFPFGDENGDILTHLKDDAGFESIPLNTDFVFHSTNYRTVFVSLKLVTSFSLIILFKFKTCGSGKIYTFIIQFTRSSLYTLLFCSGSPQNIL